MKLHAEWTNDCQGKKDYDADLVSLSTRYWPRGGGFSILDRAHPELGFQGNEARPEIKPSAKASILLSEGAVTLAEQKFEADTEAAVKAQVEQWAQEQFDKVVAALTAAFGVSAAPAEQGE